MFSWLLRWHQEVESTCSTSIVLCCSRQRKLGCEVKEEGHVMRERVGNYEIVLCGSAGGSWGEGCCRGSFGGCLIIMAPQRHSDMASPPYQPPTYNNILVFRDFQPPNGFFLFSVEHLTFSSVFLLLCGTYLVLFAALGGEAEDGASWANLSGIY